MTAEERRDEDARDPEPEAAPARPPLSAFVIAKNEESRLPRTLKALQGLADQIVVVDSGSTDRTVEIAREMGAEVFSREWTGYGPQKRFAEEKCRHDWMLNVDADEVVSPELAAEIRAVLPGAAPGAFRIRILNVYPGDERPRPFANDYAVVRLYHVEAGRYRDHPLFDRVETLTAPRRLKAPILHHPFETWRDLVDKENAFTSYQADTAPPRPRWLLRIRLVTEGPAVFFKGWILRGHVWGGWKGFAFAAVIAFARWLRIVKMLERASRPEKGSE